MTSVTTGNVINGIGMGATGAKRGVTTNMLAGTTVLSGRSFVVGNLGACQTGSQGSQTGDYDYQVMTCDQICILTPSRVSAHAA